MTAILIAVAVAFLFTLLGTPLAIRVFRAWGWGQRIREDGPTGAPGEDGHPHDGRRGDDRGGSWPPTPRPGSWCPG